MTLKSRPRQRLRMQRILIELNKKYINISKRVAAREQGLWSLLEGREITVDAKNG